MPLLREVLLSGQAALASGLLYSALACDARDGAPPVLAAAKVAGCYEFADSAGRPIHQAAFWSAPVRLDTTAALLDSDGGYRKEPGVYAVIPTATIPPEHAIDTALLRSTWQVLPPDTVLVMRSDGYIGHAIRVHADGGVPRGTQEWFNDVIDTTRLPVRHPVSARRVTCRQSAEAGARPAP